MNGKFHSYRVLRESCFINKHEIFVNKCTGSKIVENVLKDKNLISFSTSRLEIRLCVID